MAKDGHAHLGTLKHTRRDLISKGYIIFRNIVSLHTNEGSFPVQSNQVCLDPTDLYKHLGSI